MNMTENQNLKGLYPFLYGEKQDPLAMNKALVESVQQKVAHHQQTIQAFFASNGQAVVAAAGAIADVYRRNGRSLHGQWWLEFRCRAWRSNLSTESSRRRLRLSPPST